MRRLLAIMLSVAIVALPVFQAWAQSTRYRLPTSYGEQGRAGTPSFRGDDSRKLFEPAFPGDTEGGQRSPGAPGGMMMDAAGVVGAGYQIHVLGEVKSPGTYVVPPSARLASAIQRAGGLSQNGSVRLIELRRKGARNQIVDLQNFKLFGKLKDNPYLMGNDVVYVPLRKNVVQVVGAVRRPKTYELRNEKSLMQAIDLAGGFNAATAMDGQIRVIRYIGGEKVVKEVPVDKKAMKRFDVNAGDVIVVPNVVTKETEFDYNVAAIPGDQVFYPSYEDRVFVLGGVFAPGAYPFSPYYTVNQYISLAGGIAETGKEKYRIINIRGESRKAKETDRVNPGDTVMIKKRWMTPAAWMGFALSMASFGLSASATIIALRR